MSEENYTTERGSRQERIEGIGAKQHGGNTEVTCYCNLRKSQNQS